MDKLPVTLSIMASNAQGIQPLLDRFKIETGIQVVLKLYSWDSAWNTLVKPAGETTFVPDLSEMGTTWMGHLIAQNALRPFSDLELAEVRQTASFFSASWKTVTPAGDGKVWAIPWLMGARLIYFRKKIFDQAGINTSVAFQNNSAAEQTISKLASAGIAIPWMVPTDQTHTTLINASSWVWASGGEFLSPDGKVFRLLEPAGLNGLRAYFSLGRYLVPEVRNLRGLEPDEKFLSDPRAAAIISGPWLFEEAGKRKCGVEIGVALPPGPPFVGGSNLVIWKHAQNPEGALRLLQFLSRPESQAAYARQVGLLPARSDGLQIEPYRSDTTWLIAVHAARIGRGFPVVEHWGAIEEQMAESLHLVWKDVLSGNLDSDLTDIIKRRLEPAAEALGKLIR